MTVIDMVMLILSGMIALGVIMAMLNVVVDELTKGG